MAEKINTGNVIIDDKARTAHNASAVQKQADQDISGKGAGFDDTPTISALDSLRDSIVEKKKSDAKVDELGDPAADTGKSSEEAKATADKIGVDKAAAAAAAGAPADDAAAVEAARVESEKKVAEETARKSAEEVARKSADEFFKDSPALPANASPKSSEAFSAVKLRAAQEISRLQSELEKTTKEAVELREKTKEAITPELRQELESLREFRIRLDIETDPKFKEFDKGISAAHEFIYAQLKKSPAVTDEVISEIKKHGGPENVLMDKIFEAVKDPMIQRLVEAKLADLELAKFNKDQAIKANKDDVKKYLAERQQQWEASASSHNTQTKAKLDDLIGRVGWLNPVTPKADADEATKKAAEAHNAYAENIRKEISYAMADDTPEMRATLIIGMAQLFRLQASHEAVTKEREILKKELTDAKATVARLTASSTSRLRESGAAASDLPKPKDNTNIFTERAGDALDRLKSEKAKLQVAA